ncbi:putative cytochrome P450 4ac1 isoform 1-T7 [Glossina fuscipes fuscipes]
MYDFLGDGLLRTSEEKWHLRRKLLTPAFHFNMLQTFNEIFKEESLKLLEKLKHLQHKDINIGDVIDEFSLNNVCETALGVELNDIDGATRYRAAIHNIEPIIRRRLCNSLRYYGFIFYLFGQYKEHEHYVEITHNFSSKIIKRKRKKFLLKGNSSNIDKKISSSRFAPSEISAVKDFLAFFRNSYVKTRYAMLDTLLHHEAQGLVDQQGICEEVATFMLEGFDTTSTCLKFALLNIVY